MSKNAWGRKDKSKENIKMKPKFEVKKTEDENENVVIIHDIDDDGKKVKITRRIKRYKKKIRINLDVEQRSKWRPFGMGVEGKYVSFEDGTTFDVQTIEETLPFIRVKKTQKLEREKIIDEIVRKYGGEDEKVDGPTGSVYVAPSLRGTVSFNNQTQLPPEENKTVRVSNLNEMHTKEALFNLSRKIIEEFRQEVFIEKSKVADEMKDKLDEIVRKLKKKEEDIKRQEKVANKLKKKWREDVERERLKKEEKKVEKVEKEVKKNEEEKKKEPKNAYKKKPDTPEQRYAKAKAEWERLGRTYHELEFDLKQLEQRYKRLVEEIDDRGKNLEIIDDRDYIRRIVVNYDRRDDGYYAFINFDRREDAVGFYKKTREYVLDGLVLKVDWAKPRLPRRY